MEELKFRCAACATFMTPQETTHSTDPEKSHKRVCPNCGYDVYSFPMDKRYTIYFIGGFKDGLHMLVDPDNITTGHIYYTKPLDPATVICTGEATPYIHPEDERYVFLNIDHSSRTGFAIQENDTQEADYA